MDRHEIRDSRTLKIDTDSEDAGTLLATIGREVVAAGGFVHPGLTIHVRGSDMWASCDLAGGGDSLPSLVTIPAPLLIPVDRLRWDDPDSLHPTRGLEQITGSQRRHLRLWIDLYTVCDKLSIIQDRLPALALRGCPELCAHLARGWPEWRESRASLNPAGAFFQTRMFRYAPERQKLERRVLTSLIDVLNHHPAGARFDARVDGLSVKVRQPGGGARDECCVRYGDADALGMLVGYGYADLQTRFLKSVACEIQVDGFGTLRVRGPHWRGPRMDLPALDRTAEGMVISHVNLYADNAGRTSAILALLARAMQPKAAPAAIDRMTQAALLELCSVNRTFYERLRELAAGESALREARTVSAMLVEVADHQLSLLDSIDGRR